MEKRSASRCPWILQGKFQHPGFIKEGQVVAMTVTIKFLPVVLFVTGEPGDPILCMALIRQGCILATNDTCQQHMWMLRAAFSHLVRIRLDLFALLCQPAQAGERDLAGVGRASCVFPMFCSRPVRCYAMGKCRRYMTLLVYYIWMER
jgi:hypothetical protein